MAVQAQIPQEHHGYEFDLARPWLPPGYTKKQEPTCGCGCCLQLSWRCSTANEPLVVSKHIRQANREKR